jgi:hypothetical protein
VKLAPELEHALRRDGLLDLLSMIQEEPRRADYWPENFGNYVIELAGNKGVLQVVRDRGLIEVNTRSARGMDKARLESPLTPPHQEIWNAICLALVELEIN